VRHRLLFFGIVRRYKGLDLLLRTLACTRPEISLTVAGEIWADRDELFRLIRELRLGERVTLSDGYVAAADVPGYFADADALVLPYRSGTASQNALVALQFGIPVIATRAGAIAAAVCDGVNGILCAPANVPDLSRAISRLYEPGVLEQLQRGVRAPDTEPTWDRYIAALERPALLADGTSQAGARHHEPAGASRLGSVLAAFLSRHGNASRAEHGTAIQPSVPAAARWPSSGGYVSPLRAARAVRAATSASRTS
jgi:Glycosyl transferases group 1